MQFEKESMKKSKRERNRKGGINIMEKILKMVRQIDLKSSSKILNLRINLSGKY